MIKVKVLSEKRKYPTKLSVFDFDGTLFKSPEKPSGYEGNWWIEEKSLSHPAVPKKPDDSFWNIDVVNSAKKELADKNTYCIMLTGRVDQFFDDRINELLKQKGLNFEEVGLNQFGRSTGEFKLERINGILKKYQTIKNIEMWEDELDKVELYTKEFSKDYKFNINVIKGRRS